MISVILQMEGIKADRIQCLLKWTALVNEFKELEKQYKELDEEPTWIFYNVMEEISKNYFIPIVGGSFVILGFFCTYISNHIFI